MKDYVPLWDRLWQREIAVNRTLDKVLTAPVSSNLANPFAIVSKVDWEMTRAIEPFKASSARDIDAWLQALNDAGITSTGRTVQSIPKTFMISDDLAQKTLDRKDWMPHYDHPKPRPPHKVQVTREWLEAQEMLVREFYPHHQLVWRVSGDSNTWKQPPSKAQATGWGNMPPPQSDKLVGHEFSAPDVKDSADMIARWKFDWFCASLKHQFHGWWQESVLQSNITLYLLAVEAGDMVVYAKQCCVHRAEVVTAFTTHQGY